MDSLKWSIASSLPCRSAVMDGEIACLDPDGRSNFYDLLFRRRAPCFRAFDLLMVDGTDLRGLPLLERKRRLSKSCRASNRESLCGSHPPDCVDFYQLECERDLEGVVGTYARGVYKSDGTSTSGEV